MASLKYQMDYLGSPPISWGEFLQRHGQHEIIECDDNEMMQMPLSVEELEQRVGGKAEVEYLGEDSPFYLDNDGLHFVIRPLSKKRTASIPQPIHVVVYVV